MIELSDVTATMLNMRFVTIKAPAAPKEFYSEPRKTWFKVSKIKQIAKKFNLSYTLDYINNTVYFKHKE